MIMERTTQRSMLSKRWGAVSDRKNLAPELEQQFRAGKLVIAGDPLVVGSNDYGAYHPTQYVIETLGRGFRSEKSCARIGTTVSRRQTGDRRRPSGCWVE